MISVQRQAEELKAAMIKVKETNAQDKEAMNALVRASMMAFRQGIGISWSEYGEIINEVYDQ